MESQYPFPGNQTLSSQLMMLDHQIALERVGGDEDLLREIVRLFLDECPRLIAHIQEAIDAGDTRRLEREAHSLKGSVANFGAEPVVKAALALEVIGRSGNLCDAREGFQQLSRSVEVLRPELIALSEK